MLSGECGGENLIFVLEERLEYFFFRGRSQQEGNLSCGESLVIKGSNSPSTFSMQNPFEEIKHVIDS